MDLLKTNLGVSFQICHKGATIHITWFSNEVQQSFTRPKHGSVKARDVFLKYIQNIVLK